jgi:hypothetical protein
LFVFDFLLLFNVATCDASTFDKQSDFPAEQLELGLGILVDDLEAAGLAKRGEAFARVREARPRVTKEPMPFLCGSVPAVSCYDGNIGLGFYPEETCLARSGYTHELAHLLLGDPHERVEVWAVADGTAYWALVDVLCPGN